MKRLVVVFILAMLVGAQSALAQIYPSRPVTLIVPYPAGGPSDTLARVLVEQLKTGGRLVMPIGPAEAQSLALLRKDSAGEIELHEILPVRFTQLETGL